MKKWVLSILIFGTTLIASNRVQVQTDEGLRSCSVTTFRVHDVHGGECLYLSDVMVGIKSVEPLVIRCAQVLVNCRDQKVVEKTEKE